MDKNAFVDIGYEEGLVFSRFFFGSSDFLIATLKRLSSGADARSNKEALASNLAAQFHYGEVAPASILRALARQPRQWLSLRIGEPVELPFFRDPALLLSGFGEEGWYGPVLDEDDVPRWYIKSFSIPHILRRDQSAREVRIRWLVYAEVEHGYVSFSWNNFTLSAPESASASVQFPFWKYLPSSFEEIEHGLGGSWGSLRLHQIVLQDIWNQYIDDPDFRWDHLRIRAELKGVALNAHSSGASDISVSGLKELTKDLARASGKALKATLTEEEQELMENALLQVLIREWGTNSYEFRLTRIGEEGDKSRELFRAHCYFGLREGMGTQDSFQHLKCYSDAGSHVGAANFVMEHSVLSATD